jgi:hypothetical protein
MSESVFRANTHRRASTTSKVLGTPRGDCEETTTGPISRPKPGWGKAEGGPEPRLRHWQALHSLESRSRNENPATGGAVGRVPGSYATSMTRQQGCRGMGGAAQSANASSNATFA